MDNDDVKELEDAMEPIWEIARGFGLDPFPVHFELVPPSIMYEFGSYGLPGRFSHWSHGKVYHRMKTQYDYGLSKIYELVINTNPSYAFLMEGNSVLQNKLVIAHVLGHCDFFKHNAYFAHTNRQMVESASLNAERIRRYEQEHGYRQVERFLDAVLSIQEHIDPYAMPEAGRRKGQHEPQEQERVSGPPRSSFDDLFSLTPDVTPVARPEKQSDEPRKDARFPARPDKDIVRFIAEHSRRLEPWQRDVVGIVWQEMQYFIPQMQTKVANEGWACATGDSLVLTEHGFMRFDELYEAGRAGRAIHVAAGGPGDLCHITDYHKEELVPTIRIRTRRGLTIEGAHKHKILLAGGTWAYLRDVQLGDMVATECGTGVWPEAEQQVSWQPAVQSSTLEHVAALAGVSTSTVMRHMKGRATLQHDEIDTALKTTAYRKGPAGKVLPTRSRLRPPASLNADTAWLLGYFVGDGNRTKSGIGFTTGDDEIATRLAATIKDQFDLDARTRWDSTSKTGRWRLLVHSRELRGWLASAGLDLAARAKDKQIPATILRSPKHVVSSFLRGYFDADAYAGPSGVILSSSSQMLIKSAQTVLLNYGILTRQRLQSDGCIHLAIRGEAAGRFLNEIGFGLSRKQRALEQYVQKRQWFKSQTAGDEIVSIEHGVADVYDITVDTKHSYVANGFINHNSLWHARIMRQLPLTDSEFTEYASLNSGVIAPSRRSINPYYLGVKILEDIERRWNNPTEEEREKFGRKGGEGHKKLFEVREMESDVSLIRNYLTAQLVEDLDLYLYERQGDEWVIVDKDWEHVRDNLVARMANFGNPTILVEDGDYRRNGELLLTHLFDGQEIDVAYAEKTLEHVQFLWGRPVHLRTHVGDEDVLLSYDGSKHERSTS